MKSVRKDQAKQLLAANGAIGLVLNLATVKIISKSFHKPNSESLVVDLLYFSKILV
jgi:hypothetical protein